MAGRETHLSPSLEDYLEAIYNLKLRSDVARVKDIARDLDVTMPSVTGAIRSLASKGLVKHQPYENVELTKDGLNRARGIALRHSAVREFLMSVLGLCEEDAETEACGIEHAIRPDTLDKLLKFIDFVRACGEDKTLRLDDFRHFLEHGSYPDGCEQPRQDREEGSEGGTCTFERAVSSVKLSDLCPGMKGRITVVSGRGSLRKRLMEMGLTSDAQFEVVRVAPLGDPVEIKVRGYCLSLRKSEAEHVAVEVE